MKKRIETVQQLIDELRKFPHDAPIHCDKEGWRIERITIQPVTHGKIKSRRDTFVMIEVTE